jgi:hypothetical protein
VPLSQTTTFLLSIGAPLPPRPRFHLSVSLGVQATAGGRGREWGEDEQDGGTDSSNCECTIAVGCPRGRPLINSSVEENNLSFPLIFIFYCTDESVESFTHSCGDFLRTSNILVSCDHFLLTDRQTISFF